jgi:hypothetical protein
LPRYFLNTSKVVSWRSLKSFWNKEQLRPSNLLYLLPQMCRKFIGEMSEGAPGATEKAAAAAWRYSLGGKVGGKGVKPQ